MAKTNLVRIAVEGATADGRMIERVQLEQAAANYEPDTYAARVNCEHYMGFSPDSPFKSYGSVLTLHTKEIELTIGGEQHKRLALYAEIEANEHLIALNKAGQKLFTSAELHPNFADSGEAYLVGLAITDRPASLGTEVLKFAAMARSNIFSDAQETSIEMLSSTDPADIGEAVKTGFLSALTSMFSAKTKDDKREPITQPAPANDNMDMQAFASLMGDQIALAVKPQHEAVTLLKTELAELKTQLAGTPAPSHFTRTPASGGNGVKTDC